MFSKIYHSIFNQSVYKVLLAMAIPALICGGWIFSLQSSDVLIKEQTKEMKEHPTVEKTTVDNYSLKEVDDTNTTKWDLIAKRGIMAADASKDVWLDQVTLRYYDGKVLKMSITAPKGVANEVTHIVILDSDKTQRVVAENGVSHARLEASKVELNKKNQFVATGGVNINMPGVAKVTGNLCTGVLEKDSELKNFKIIGNTHAIIGS
jgi:lipopolysaccharide export system protein LptC